MKTLLLFLITFSALASQIAEIRTTTTQATLAQLDRISSYNSAKFLRFEIEKIVNSRLDQSMRVVSNDLKKIGENAIYDVEYNHNSSLNEIIERYFSDSSWYPEVCKNFRSPYTAIANCRSAIFELLNIYEQPLSYVYINGDASSSDFKFLYVFKEIDGYLFHFRMTIQDETLKRE